jgi:hypothetical protein
MVLALVFGVWWLTQPHDPPEDPTSTGGSVEATPEGGLDPVMRGRLELAVTSAANAAECGYTEVGFGYRDPEEAPRHLVALMRSATGPTPEVSSAGVPMVEYVLDRPQSAWQVAVRLVEAEGPTLVIEGYGADLEEPIFTRSVPCS